MGTFQERRNTETEFPTSYTKKPAAEQSLDEIDMSYSYFTFTFLVKLLYK